MLIVVGVVVATEQPHNDLWPGNFLQLTPDDFQGGNVNTSSRFFTTGRWAEGHPGGGGPPKYLSFSLSSRWRPAVLQKNAILATYILIIAFTNQRS